MAVNPDTTVRKIVSLPKDLWERVCDFRFQGRFNTEAEAIRRLLSLGIAAHEDGLSLDANGRLTRTKAD